MANRTGNPGYGKMENIRMHVDKFSPLFWDLMEKYAQSKDTNKQRFFIQEFNKIQTKMIPQEVGGVGGDPIKVQWMSPSPIVHADGPNNSTTQPNVGFVLSS